METSQGQGNSLERLAPLIESAQLFAERWDERYRIDVFRLALGKLLQTAGPSDVGTAAGELAGKLGIAANERPTSRSNRPMFSPSVGSPVEKLARALDVSADAVERTVQFGEGETIVILGRVEGKAKSSLQIKYSIIFIYIKEMALGSRMVDVEELRKLCVDQGCYDSGNFTTNFKSASDLMREQGEKGARTRRYLLTQKGIGEAKGLLLAMVSV